VHVWSVTPIHVSPEELARRQARYDALSPAGVRVELVDIGADAPRQLASEQEVRDSEGLVARALRNAPDRADALIWALSELMLSRRAKARVRKL